MALGRRPRERQAALFVTADALPKSPGHPVYTLLNRLLADADFDTWIEARCAPYYRAAGTPGRPSLPPGVYFRMLLIGYFEGLDSQRQIAWRCADSLSLREFLGIGLSERTPDHSTLTLTRQRLPAEVFTEMFQFVLQLAHGKRLLTGKTVGVDSTTLEANAALKEIVRKDSGEDWKAYVTRLMQEAGLVGLDEQPTDDELRRFDKGRKDKTVSNEEWQSPTDPEATIAKMKDGSTHLAYKAEHVVDLDSDLILAAEIRPANHADAHTLADSLMAAQANLEAAGVEQRIEEVVADKGYHAADTLELCDAFNLRTYIPEPKRKGERDWSKLSPDQQRAVRLNQQRMSRDKGQQLQKQRSERVERSFAHLCESGGMRRTWLRGLVDVTKRYLVAVAGHNLSRILLKLFGIGKPRTLQGRRTGSGTGRNGRAIALGWLGNAWRTHWNFNRPPNALRERFPRDESTILALAT